jgi:hypothetical protein
MWQLPTGSHSAARRTRTRSTVTRRDPAVTDGDSDRARGPLCLQPSFSVSWPGRRLIKVDPSTGMSHHDWIINNLKVKVFKPY